MPHILLVEDTQMVADAVRDTLELEGWHVEMCDDGLDAVILLESTAQYDLLLFDNELPNVGGLDLTRYARTLAHRKLTPIIMISASECGRAARRAGADAFVRKPQDVGKLVEIIARLLDGPVDGSGGARAS